MGTTKVEQASERRFRAKALCFCWASCFLVTTSRYTPAQDVILSLHARMSDMEISHIDHAASKA